MPNLDTQLHLNMLETFKQASAQHGVPENCIYGLHWGDPDTMPPLRFIKLKYVIPYVNPNHTAVEIGPGGGRWTRYLLPFQRIFAVDYHVELLDQLKKTFNSDNIQFIKNNGDDFPGIKDESVDYVFSFGVFVHLELNIIDAYLKNMRRIVKPDANVVIQYSDKTKIMARNDPAFSENTPEKMRELVLNAGYKILEEDLTSLWHSSVIRIAK